MPAKIATVVSQFLTKKAIGLEFLFLDWDEQVARRAYTDSEFTAEHFKLEIGRIRTRKMELNRQVENMQLTNIFEGI